MIFSGQQFFDGKTFVDLPTGFTSKGAVYLADGMTGKLNELKIVDIITDCQMYRHVFLYNGKRYIYHCDEPMVNAVSTKHVQGYIPRSRTSKSKFKPVQVEVVDIFQVLLDYRYACEIETDAVLLGVGDLFFKFERGEDGSLQFCRD